MNNRLQEELGTRWWFRYGSKILRKDARNAEKVAEERAKLAGSKLYGQIKTVSEARQYIRALYDAADEEGKIEIAYLVGKQLTNIHGKKK